MTDDHPLLVAICDPTRLEIDAALWAAAVFEGGVDLLQLRAPDLREAEIERVARALLTVAPLPHRVQINGYIDLAALLGIGVHLPERAGPDRPRLTPASRSVHNPESAQASSAFDFVVAGHIFSTPSKPGLPPRGTSWLFEMVTACPVPVVAIGGITAENAPEVIAAGAAGIAVIGALASSNEPRRDAERLRQAIDSGWKGERHARANDNDRRHA